MKRNENVTIFLIDDDEVDVMGVRRAFKHADMNNEIIVASNGIEGLGKLRDASVPRPRIILLDINMPRMGGMEFLEQARKDPNLHSSIIFVLTTSNAEEDRRSAYRHNVAGYILKDPKNEGFIDVVDLFKCYSNVVEFP